MAASRVSAGLIVLSGFFAFGAGMAALSASALLFPHGALDGMWRLNPAAHEALLTMGRWAEVLMLLVSLACGFAAIGIWRQTSWGHRMALGVLAVNLLGDAFNALFRGDLRTLIGLPIGGALIVYLLRPSVRGRFKPARVD